MTFLAADFSPLASSQIGNTHLYTGRELDIETGLQLNRNRYYASHLGRWINRDPIGYEGGTRNLYEYVGSTPNESVDPSGNEELPVFIPPSSEKPKPTHWGTYPLVPPDWKPQPSDEIDEFCATAANGCNGCNRDKCRELIETLIEIAETITVDFGLNPCDRWNFKFSTTTNFYTKIWTNPCVDVPAGGSVGPTTWWLGITGGHAAQRYCLCSGKCFYIDNGIVGGGDHYFESDEIPWYMWGEQ